MVKYGCGLQGHWDSTIYCISTMNKWIELIFYMLMVLGKLKVTIYIHRQIWLWPFRSFDSKMYFISKINWGIKLLFCMLEKMQKKFVRPLIMLCIFGLPQSRLISKYCSILPNFVSQHLLYVAWLKLGQNH